MHLSPTFGSAMQHMSSTRRSGFTLIEMLVVMAIVALLAGLIMIPVNRSRHTAQVASVVAEISNLEKALADFKLKYGVDIPSSVVLHETSMGWADTGVATTRSKSVIGRIWPQFDFTYALAATPGQYDINGDGQIKTDGPLVLRGVECLVFFLGGVCLTQTEDGTTLKGDRDNTMGASGTPGKWIPIGFSTIPSFPFSRAGSSRVGPFYEFDASRMVNTFETSNMRMPEYRDTLPGQSMPYAFASAARGSHPPTTGNGSYCHQDLGSGSDVFAQVYKRMANEPYNPKTYQIISPGFDSRFRAPDPGPAAGFVWEPDMLIPSNRAEERDNIANFSKGQLQN